MSVTCYRVCRFYDGSTLLYEEEYPEGGLGPGLTYTPGHPNHLPPYDEDEYELTKITYNGRTVTNSSITCPYDDFDCIYTFKLIHTYWAILELDGNGGQLNSGDTIWQKIQSKESTSSSATISISYNVSFVRDGFTFLGYSEDPDARVATYEKSDSYAIRTSSEDSSDAEIVTLYAVWGSDLLTLTVEDVTYEKITISVAVDGLSSTDAVYMLQAGAFEEGASNALRTDASPIFAGPSYSTTFTFDRLTYSTTYECVIYIWADYGGTYTGHSAAIAATTEEKWVDAFIESPVIQEGASTDEESKVRLKITAYSNDNGNAGRFYLTTYLVVHDYVGVERNDTSPTFTLDQDDEYTHAVIFTGLPGACQYEYWIRLYDANGELLDEYEMIGWTNELKRPYQWEWDPLIVKGGMVPTTEISETEYEAKFITAAEWLAFIENIELVADFCGYDLNATDLSNSKSGVSSDREMKPLQTNSAVYLIESMEPDEPVPTVVTSGVDWITAAYFNGLRDALNSVKMKET